MVRVVFHTVRVVLRYRPTCPRLRADLSRSELSGTLYYYHYFFNNNNYYYYYMVPTGKSHCSPGQSYHSILMENICQGSHRESDYIYINMIPIGNVMIMTMNFSLQIVYCCVFITSLKSSNFSCILVTHIYQGFFRKFQSEQVVHLRCFLSEHVGGFPNIKLKRSHKIVYNYL